MMQPLARSLCAALVSMAALALLTACASTQVVSHQRNPDYAGTRLKSVMVVGVTLDEVTRRVFEDRMAALLEARGVKATPAYRTFPRAGKVDEAKLRDAVASSGVEGLIVSRVGGIEQSTSVIPGQTAMVGIGAGWGGFYPYYTGIWQSVTIPPERVTGPSRTIAETRLFDARTGALVWTGTFSTGATEVSDTLIRQYTEVVVGTMAADGVL